MTQKSISFAIAVAAMLAASAAAAQGTPHAAPGYDATAAPPEPGRPDDTRPMTATPDRLEASPARQEYTETARIELQQWEERIDEYRQSANNLGDREAMEHGQELHDIWVTAKERWQSMKQTEGGHWEVSKKNFTMAYQDLKQAWEEAPPVR